jgi:EAL domain-containing protein (putative c-di-GMP-specific phosphodiesterase class I)
MRANNQTANVRFRTVNCSSLGLNSPATVQHSRDTFLSPSFLKKDAMLDSTPVVEPKVKRPAPKAKPPARAQWKIPRGCNTPTPKLPSSMGRLYPPRAQIRAANHQALARGDLQRALERREFQLYYQPSVDLATRTVCGAEALLRWHHPVRGALAPKDFLPLAQRTGHIVAIGEWVFAESCQQHEAWREHGVPSLRLAINISAPQLLAKQFVQGVQAVLASTGVDPTLVELEVCETLLFQTSKPMRAVLKALTELGVQFALDDWGTGDCAASHLRRWPIKVVKLRQSLVHALPCQAAAASQARVIRQMGDALNWRVVAEGVETLEQRDIVQANYCEEGRGFYLGRPMPSGEFVRFLTRPAPLPLLQAHPHRYTASMGKTLPLPPSPKAYPKEVHKFKAAPAPRRSKLLQEIIATQTRFLPRPVRRAA